MVQKYGHCTALTIPGTVSAPQGGLGCRALEGTWDSGSSDNGSLR